METGLAAPRCRVEFEEARRLFLDELEEGFHQVEGKRTLIILPDRLQSAVLLDGQACLPHLLVLADDGGAEEDRRVVRGVEAVCIVATAEEVNPQAAATVWRPLSLTGHEFYLFVPRSRQELAEVLCERHHVRVSFLDCF